MKKTPLNITEVTTERLKNLLIGISTLIINQWPYAIGTLKRQRRIKLMMQAFYALRFAKTAPF